MEKKKNRPVMLMIIDGFGYSKQKKGNPIYVAKTPFLNSLWKKYPHTYALSSGQAVGLPDGQVGNSEAGHLNIGSGRIVDQSLKLINKKIEEKDFERNEVIINAINNAKKNNSSLHLVGLLSDGGVHSLNTHLYELIRVVIKNKIDHKTYIHIFTDGQDVPRDTALIYIDELFAKIKGSKIKIASVAGSYYSMDRDQRWERVQQTYDAMVNGKGRSFSGDLKDYIQFHYDLKVKDKFITPAFNSEVRKFIEDYDSVIFYNFRSDRPREISHLLVPSKMFKYQVKGKKLKNIYFATMRNYFGIDSHVIYRIEKIDNTLGEIVHKNGLKQLRIAETEKYPHVTFFFDGGKDLNYQSIKKIIVPSPKVATYDLKPEMSIEEITQQTIKNLPDYDLTILNIANPDMLGHTGSFKAAVKALEATDLAIKKIHQAFVNNLGGVIFIVSDHGNVEEMFDQDKLPMTKHTTNVVPIILTDKKFSFRKEFANLNNPKAKLADYAPTLLELLNIKPTKDMTGSVLIKKK